MYNEVKISYCYLLLLILLILNYLFIYYNKIKLLLILILPTLPLSKSPPWIMKSLITRWNAEPLYPKPFSPNQTRQHLALHPNILKDSSTTSKKKNLCKGRGNSRRFEAHRRRKVQSQSFRRASPQDSQCLRQSKPCLSLLIVSPLPENFKRHRV